MSRAWIVAAAALLTVTGCDRGSREAAPDGALRAGARSAAERAVYARQNWKPAWDATTVAQLRQALADRRAHGLDQVDFSAGDAPGATPEQADLARTRAALAYAGALARGAVDPTKLHAIYTLARPAPDLGAGLAAALKEKRVDRWLEELAPQDGAYRALSAAYLAAGKGGAPAPAPSPVVTCTTPEPPAAAPAPPAPAPAPVPTPSPGATPAADTTPIPDDPDRAAPPPAVAPTPTPTPSATPGVAAPPPPHCVTVTPPPPRPAGDRRPVLAVALERLRWLARAPAATRIDVNIATARLTYWRDGQVADARPVVVGASETRTPQLGSPMFRLVANPTWTIPASIIRKDKMARRSAASLARSGMAWRNGRLVQKPGPRNSLGLVKFDMRNGYAIYLHDTPAKGLFAAAERHRSHGCVRVKDALGFAAMLAGDEGIADAWARATARDRTGYVSLPREIPVRLLYATVLPGDDGTPVVRGDPYGWDAPIARQLGYAAISRPVVEAPPADMGP